MLYYSIKSLYDLAHLEYYDNNYILGKPIVK